MRPTNGTIIHDAAVRKQSRGHRGRLIVLLALAVLATFLAVAPFGTGSSVHAQTSGGDRKIIFVGGIAGHSDCTQDDTKKYVDFWTDIRKAAAKGLQDENISLSASDVIGFSYTDSNCPTSDYSRNFGTVPHYSSQDTCNGIDPAATRLNSLISKLVGADASVRIDIVGHSMGGAVIAGWAASQPADSANVKAIHAVVTLDSPLQGVDDIHGPLGSLWENFTGCPSASNQSLNDLLKSSKTSIIPSIRDPKNTTSKVPFVTIRNVNDGVVPSDDATLPGVWIDGARDYPVGCTGSDLLSHTCVVHDPNAESAVTYAVSHDVIDERPANPIQQSGTWSTASSQDYYLGATALQSNNPGDSISASFTGPSLTLVYSGPDMPLFGNWTAPSVDVSIDSGPATNVKGIPCLPPSTPFSPSFSTCSQPFQGLGAGDHSVTLTVKNAGTKGGFIFDYFETETAHSSTPIPCPPAANVDVVLIIDQSGSMDQNDPHGQRLDAAEAFVNNTENGDAIGVVTFNSDATTVMPLTIGSDRTGMINAIKGITNSDGTNIGAGLQRAYDLLSADSSANKKAAILLTDGKDNPGSYGGQDQLFATAGWPVYVIGLGTDIDPDFLNKVASGTGTKQFTPLSSPSQLISVYFDIARQQKCGVDRLNETHHLAQGETQKTTVTIPAGQLSASFLASWPGSVVDLSLIDPSGRLIDASTTDASISHAKGLTYELYRVENPVSGDWIVQVFGRDLPAGGEDMTVQAASIPNPSAQTAAPQKPSPSPPASGGFDYALAAAATAIVGVAIVLGGGFWVFSSANGPAGTLSVSSPGAAPSAFPLRRRSRTISIGRSRSNDIVIDDPFVSRNHARISKVGDAFVVEDLASTAGVTVNGAAVSMSPLRDGDVIGLGDSKLVFRLGRGT